jgi:hypothetical protein|tara:strand:+ start:1484 stop:1744 length:261 start_codon:yes stop_codon:yes gene_type:complete
MEHRYFFGLYVGGDMGKPKSKIKIVDYKHSRQRRSCFAMATFTSLYGEEFDSISDAASTLNIARPQIVAHLNGKLNHVRGLVFERI